MGSPGFMSPEQAEGGVVGPPSDVFSLGSVLTFAATGEGPFGEGSARRWSTARGRAPGNEQGEQPKAGRLSGPVDAIDGPRRRHPERMPPGCAGLMCGWSP